MSLSFGTLFWWSIWRKHLKISLTPSAARAAIIRFGTGAIAAWWPSTTSSNTRLHGHAEMRVAK
jgi:hypothetical protein